MATPPRKDWQQERGGSVDGTDKPAPGHPLTEEERIDETIDESFPASDPPAWNAASVHEQ